jgi:heme oxygenase
LPQSEIRQRLRAATADVHERLHVHEGFAAAAAGRIELPAYRRLLARLLGFHRAFEKAIRASITRDNFPLDANGRRRSPMLETDLKALGWDGARLLEIPEFDGLTQPRNPGETMGALYVIEGSTLGGVQIARALAPLCEPLAGRGRSYFLGYGERHGAQWRAFVQQLDDCAKTASDESSIIRGAATTFREFETWMKEWNVPLELATARFAPAIAS